MCAISLPLWAPGAGAAMALKRVAELVSAAPMLVRSPPKVALPFYHSPEWRALVRSIKLERGAWCETCGAAGRIFGDHVVEVKDGGALLDPGNVKLLCGRCHGRKTARMKARRSGLG